jgi:replication factor C large subunit
MMWSEKHRPKTVQEMVGNEESRLAVLKWLGGWMSGSKPLLLIGPPGTGKTTFVRALGIQFGYHLVEMNASDTRNKKNLQEILVPALQNTANLFGEKILLFLDEVDGISVREDSGGLDVLVELMKEPTVPVIMAANAKSTKIRELAKACKTIEFFPVPPRLLMMYLDHVLQSEGVKLELGDRISVVNNSMGDIRSMINSLQSRATGYATVSNKDVVEIDIADAVNGYFSAESVELASQFIAKADASYPDPRYGGSAEEKRKDMMVALFSSIASSHLEQGDLALMLDFLSRVDIVIGRANANREWRLLKYANSIIALGLYERSRRKGIRYSQYAMPWHAMGQIFARSQSTRKILGKLAVALHTSRSSVGLFVLPYFIRLMIDEKIDPIEFASTNFNDESVGVSIAKEIERVKRK